METVSKANGTGNDSIGKQDRTIPHGDEQADTKTDADNG